jgi:hypothetical protein
MVLVGDAEFDGTTGEVRRSGVVTRLEPQPAAVLALLAARPGELVTHDEIRQAIWGGTTHVNFQQSLHYCIRRIRIALDDNSNASRVIETVPRRGYRLRSIAVPPPARSRRWIAWTTAALVVTAVAVMVERRPNNHHQIAVAVVQTVHDFVY